MPYEILTDKIVNQSLRLLNKNFKLTICKLPNGDSYFMYINKYNKRVVKEDLMEYLLDRFSYSKLESLGKAYSIYYLEQLKLLRCHEVENNEIT